MIAANDSRLGPRVVLECPLNGCGWEREQVRPGPQDYVWQTTLAETIQATMAAASAADEAACRLHLAEHPVEDFLTTIAELRGELAAWESIELS